MKFTFNFKHDDMNLFVVTFNSSISANKVYNELRILQDFLNCYANAPKLTSDNAMEISMKVINKIVESYMENKTPNTPNKKLIESAGLEFAMSKRIPKDILQKRTFALSITSDHLTKDMLISDVQSTDPESLVKDNYYAACIKRNENCYLIDLSAKKILIDNIFAVVDAGVNEDPDVNFDWRISINEGFVCIPFNDLQDCIDYVEIGGIMQIKTFSGEEVNCWKITP